MRCSKLLSQMMWPRRQLRYSSSLRAGVFGKARLEFVGHGRGGTRFSSQTPSTAGSSPSGDSVGSLVSWSISGHFGPIEPWSKYTLCTVVRLEMAKPRRKIPSQWLSSSFVPSTAFFDPCLTVAHFLCFSLSCCWSITEPTAYRLASQSIIDSMFSLVSSRMGRDKGFSFKDFESPLFPVGLPNLLPLSSLESRLKIGISRRSL